MTKEFNYEPRIKQLLTIVILDPEATVTYPTAVFFPDENHWEIEWETREAKALLLAKLQEEKNREELDYIPF